MLTELSRIVRTRKRPLSAFELLVRLAPLSRLTLESVLGFRSRMLFVRDRLPPFDPVLTKAFLTLSHLLIVPPSPFFFPELSGAITRSSQSTYSLFADDSSGCTGVATDSRAG